MSIEGDSGSYVYLYRSTGTQQKAKYVGYGRKPARALSHAAESHNDALRSWLERGDYSLEIAGPYADEKTGLEVEAALISAMAPEFNRAVGNGHRFLPLGVPADLADRIGLAPVHEGDLAQQAGGALFVYLAAGDVLADGRIMADPSNPDEKIIAADAEAWWQIERHLDEWIEHPTDAPRALVAVHGPHTRARFVIGSFEIDVQLLLSRDPSLRQGSLWKIPLVNREDADFAALRGRKLTYSSFGQLKQQLYHWVDEHGETRWDGKQS
ncbi:hypothetical protein [Clavibacter zhangzhiyongii]|uniref:GIY-YIG domain-containing protein n=1 Tax=Clavibacter zhangzhiyongii TaxID=2768071 RepID=A0A7L7Z1J6_9MICO|nr:hypothetical protein [Clavibacter zhangzhiyongii]QOD43541.1 hypothetical protein H9X71_13285 [Clavibacter zhangzhiyongii]